MKKIFLAVLILLLTTTLFGCVSESESNKPEVKEEVEQTDGSDEHLAKRSIGNLVKDFGKKLQKVSLQDAQDRVIGSMEDNYSDFVSVALLEKWQSDCKNAPGRMNSSYCPDRIEILPIEKLSEDMYEVKGHIIEIKGVENRDSQIAAKRPIILVVKKMDNRWRIDDVTLGDCEEIENVLDSSPLQVNERTNIEVE